MLFATGEPGSLSSADVEAGERAAQEALRLDPTLGEARTALGKLHVRQWRWKEAEREARRALETSPDDATARQWLGTLLMRLGQCDEALAQVQAGVRIDPLAPIVNEAVGDVYLGCGRPAEAIEPIRMVVAMYPDIARSRRQLGTVHARVGNFSAGLPALRESVRLDPDDCLNHASLAQALGASGARGEARAIVTKLERNEDLSPVSPYCLAIGYAAVGDGDRAFDSLERAYARHVSLLDLLLVEWRLDPYRSDPRYAELLGKVGLLPVRDHCGRRGTRAFVQGARRSGPSRNSEVIPLDTRGSEHDARWKRQQPSGSSTSILSKDGNGRLHRCLIHHVLAERHFTPPGMVFPVSSVMWDRIDDYQTTLQGHSGPLMPFIEWRPTPERNLEVLNETADFYRYLDGTDVAEFL